VIRLTVCRLTRDMADNKYDYMWYGSQWVALHVTGLAVARITGDY
jgi:hypothetical protein